MMNSERGHDHQVLIVDDDAPTREALSELVQLCTGHSAVAAVDGEEALAMLRGGLSPCVILLDLWMPRSDGYSFRTAQLFDRVLREVPVVICSADPMAPRGHDHLQAAGYLRKPVTAELIIEAVSTHCWRAAS